jgi:DNA-binding GntR family transcriptional regulator
MYRMLKGERISKYFDLNTTFHNVYLDLSTNEMLKSQVNIIRQRLFDFGVKGDWVAKVRELNYREHLKLISLIEEGDAKVVADFLRDVHMVINW